MHIQEHFRKEGRDELLGFIGEYPLATFVVGVEGRMTANHFPMIVTDGVLAAHIPAANPIAKVIDGQNALCIFTGPDAYVSPSWYPSKQAHGKVVPTWNYSAVHVSGKVATQDSVAWKMSHLEALTQFFETNQTQPWRVSDAPRSFTEKMIGAIVGLEVSIDEIEGKFKLGQNRSEEDRSGAISGLRSAGASEIAGMMIRE